MKNIANIMKKYDNVYDSEVLSTFYSLTNDKFGKYNEYCIYFIKYS